MIPMLAGASGQIHDLHGQGRDAFGVGVADDRHQQSAQGIDHHADMHVALVDQLSGGQIQTRIELRKL